MSIALSGEAKTLLAVVTAVQEAQTKTLPEMIAVLEQQIVACHVGIGKCRAGCGFGCTAKTQGYCSMCFKKTPAGQKLAETDAALSRARAQKNAAIAAEADARYRASLDAPEYTALEARACTDAELKTITAFLYDPNTSIKDAYTRLIESDSKKGAGARPILFTAEQYNTIWGSFPKAKFDAGRRAQWFWESVICMRVVDRYNLREAMGNEGHYWMRGPEALALKSYDIAEHHAFMKEVRMQPSSACTTTPALTSLLPSPPCLLLSAEYSEK
jgi:hypothetical protein